MTLANQVQVARRYQRAIRIEADLDDRTALEGFICPQSSAMALETMARHILEAGQYAFTLTGPYGCGKSSLVVVLGAMLNGNDGLRREAVAILGEKTSSLLFEALPPRNIGWTVLGISGRRDQPAQVIGEAVEKADLLNDKKKPKIWSERQVLDALEEIAARNTHMSGGLAIFIDEFGKFLESAARDGTDIHLFQQLAELACRSGGRLLFVGLLHQAFEEYARRLSYGIRDEWLKIQGRFIDLPINADGNEQIALLADAIESDHRPDLVGMLAKNVAGLFNGNTHPNLAWMLEDCWPLHPVTSCLLGPLSRRRFGQNQRSLFGFLNSAEPCGFRDFLKNASEEDLYTPDQLWDYLHFNLESSILVSSDGHRWALATDALERCESKGASQLHVRILKTIALTDLLKDRSPLSASQALVELALNDHCEAAIREALSDLKNWSLVAFRKFAGAWKIFEGSDFDIDSALEQAVHGAPITELQSLEQFASFQPIVAKRHYHESGALRWFNVHVVPLVQLEQFVCAYEPCNGAVGGFMLAIPTQTETKGRAERLCRQAAVIDSNWDIVVGLSGEAWRIPSLMVELLALCNVRDNHPELQGDRVARVEVSARIGAVREQIENDFARAFDRASWRHKNARAKRLSRSELNTLASELTNDRFCKAPRIHNELLSRTKPSGSAVAALNALLRRMVLNERDKRLGIVGFPAEGGLYVSILEATKLHRKTAEGWRFVSPDSNAGDPRNVEPLWIAARKFLSENSDCAVPISELNKVWKAAPYGVKDGLLPVLAVAFLLSEREKLAFYCEEIFRTSLSESDVEILAKNPELIQIRWVDLSGVSRDLLMELINIVRELEPESEALGFEPIEVARSLVGIHDNLPPWAHRTQRLSPNAKRVRNLLKQAKDPNKLIFDDLMKLGAESNDESEGPVARQIARAVHKGLKEMRDIYPAMLKRFRETFLAELRVPTVSPRAMQNLRNRAANIRELGGDYRLEGFIIRLEKFEDSDKYIEELAGIVANKPIDFWTDLEVDRAMVEISDMAQRFVRAEAFAHVKGRPDKSHAVAVVVGIDGHQMPFYDEFHISDKDRFSVKLLVDEIEGTLNSSGEERRNVLLAALAEISARYLDANGSMFEAAPGKTMNRDR